MHNFRGGKGPELITVVSRVMCCGSYSIDCDKMKVASLGTPDVLFFQNKQFFETERTFDD